MVLTITAATMMVTVLQLLTVTVTTTTTRFPGQTEVYDGIDNVGGDIDDDDAGVTGTTTFFLDNDSDGAAGLMGTACVQPAGTYTSQTDCNDSNASRYPNATEIGKWS